VGNRRLVFWEFSEFERSGEFGKIFEECFCGDFESILKIGFFERILSFVGFLSFVYFLKWFWGDFYFNLK
jgi:hypothetical protein